jgi:2-polyprenyl-6-methoxyphenol hydroxylase-like FAD-dependent oxidoreductase
LVADDLPVLIVGAGPVGLAVAGDLAWRGVPSLLVEKANGVITQPKMDLIGPRTMEFCRRWGIEDAVRNCPYNPDHPQDNVWLESLTGYEFGREPFPCPREVKPPPQSPVRRERCPQDMFDPILLKWVQSMPEARISFNTELISFTEHELGVSAVISSNGEEKRVEASYLVGADGGSSSVREILGIQMQGKPALTYATNVIFRCKDFWALHEKRKAYRYIFIGLEGTWATLVAIDGHDRFRFSVVGDGTKRSYTPDEIRLLICRAMGKPFDFEILSVMPWVRRELVAERYGSRRVFIAGDAAHVNSPTGAFGMNTGMQDAVDLSWKLWATLEGWGGPALLRSYEVERRPVALRNVAEASANLKRMLSPREALSPQVFQPGPEGDAAREVFGSLYTQAMKREWYTLDIHLGFHYEGSPVIEPDGQPEPADPPMIYTQTARPGSRAPHAWLEPGFSTLDLYGRKFVLLRLDANIDVESFMAAAAHSRLPVSVKTIADPSVRELYGAPLVLVRPDGMVAWRGASIPYEASALVDKVRGSGARVMATAAPHATS